MKTSDQDQMIKTDFKSDLKYLLTNGMLQAKRKKTGKEYNT